MNTAADQTPPRVLVIDDNRAIHDDFRKILCGPPVRSARLGAAAAELFGEDEASANCPVRAATFAVDVAAQGEEGLALVQQALAAGRPYAMAFVDGRMPPGWDGVETVEHIWAVQPELQVVICTAYSDYSWEEMARRLGHSDRLVILKKPFDNIEALQLATSLSEKWRLLQQTRLQLETLEATIARRTEQLRKSEEHFRLIAENVGDLIVIVDAHGRRRYQSPSYGSLLGYHEADLQGGTALEHVHADDRALVASCIADLQQGGDARMIDYRLQHRDRTWRAIESHVAPFRSAGGAIEGVLFVGRDVTTRRSLEVQLRQAQKLEAIGRLAAGVAHEINTPTQYIGDNLRFIQSAVQSLQIMPAALGSLHAAAAQGPVAPEVVRSALATIATADLDALLEEVPPAVEQALEGVKRTARIVRSLKEFSHPGTTEKVAFDLNHAIDCTVTIARHEWRYVADVVTEFDPKLPPVSALAGEINQVLLNLVVNAAQAIGAVVRDGARGVITITTRRDGDFVEVRVRDTGPGIPEEIRERIFEPFFTTKGVGTGTGQGLAMARAAVVERHGGTLGFETEVGRGTTFIVRLPVGRVTTQGRAA